MRARPPLHYPDIGAHTVLHQAAEDCPERVAIRFRDVTLTYRELDGLVNATTRALMALGLQPGERVALVAAASVEVVVAQLAVAQAGGAFVMVNPGWTDDEISTAFVLTRPDAVIVDGACAERVSHWPDTRERLGIGVTPSFGNDLVVQTRNQRGQRPASRGATWHARDVAIVFSSGTTGTPKAVRHTHGSLLANVWSWLSAAAIGSDDRLQLFLPLFHTYGIVTVMSAIASRAPLRLIPEYDLDAVLANVADERITMIFGAAPVYAALAQQDLDRLDISSVRQFVWGATPVVPSTARTLTARTGVPVLPAYGASEAPVLFCGDARRPERDPDGSVGQAVSDVAARVVDSQTGATMPSGESGEIQVRGPQVMAGYLPEDANAEAFVDGWLRTGDIGWIDEDGRLHITDRVKEMLKVSGFQVSPVEVEAVLFTHPAVADCAVYGVPDERLGEAPVAAVVPADGASVSGAELIQWFEHRLARYKRIRDVRFVDAIPRNPSGKVLRRVLRDADERTSLALDSGERASTPDGEDGIDALAR